MFSLDRVNLVLSKTSSTEYLLPRVPGSCIFMVGEMQKHDSIEIIASLDQKRSEEGSGVEAKAKAQGRKFSFICLMHYALFIFIIHDTDIFWGNLSNFESLKLGRNKNSTPLNAWMRDPHIC